MSTDGKICTITNTQVLGCMDPKAENYNSSATLDDGSCDYPPAPACTVTVVSDATNYVVETDANAVDLLANGFTKPGAWVSGIVDSLAKWIWSDASAGTAAPVANDVKTFEKTFVWNGPVSDAEIVIGSDNQHTVFFNGTEVGSTAALTTFSAPVTYTIPSNLVVSGNNTVSIAVTNAGAVASGNPAGLMYDLTVSGNDKVDCTVVPLPTFTIEGYKYNDLNGDGVKDDGENGIEDWEFELLYKGEVVATTSTDVDGKYQFVIEYEEGKFPWEYQVVEVGQTNWTLTALFQLMGENTELVEICQYPKPELFVVAQDVPMVRPGVLPPSITMGCNFLNTYTEPEEEIEEEEPRRRSSSGTRVRPELPPQASSVAGEATSRPEGSVLGEQVSAVPLGAAATGAGGTAPVAPTTAIIYGIVAPLARRD